MGGVVLPVLAGGLLAKTSSSGIRPEDLSHLAEASNIRHKSTNVRFTILSQTSFVICQMGGVWAEKTVVETSVENRHEVLPQETICSPIETQISGKGVIPRRSQT